MPTDHSRVRVALRFWDWSDWARQVLRGVRHFAHDRPQWRLYPMAGSAEFSSVGRARRGHWDGIITSVLNEVPLWKRLLNDSSTRIVSITSSAPTSLDAIPRVLIDDAKIAKMAGKHLMAGGFRRLAYYLTSRGRADHRATALQEFAVAEGLPCAIYTENVKDGGPVRMGPLTRWVARLEKPVGILAWNMNFAGYVIEACHRAGVAVPEQAAVIAWDDDEVLAESMEPTISGVVMPAERLGFEGARLLDRLLRGELPPREPVLVEPSGVIHVRQSSDVSDLPDREVYLAQQYIREHAHESLKVDHLVSALMTSRRKLEQDFVRVTGRTLHQAMVDSHLERSKQLLLETDWPLDRVVGRSGFGSKRRFHSVFTMKEGMSPLVYRSRFKGQ